MNCYNFLILAEKLIELYSKEDIAKGNVSYTSEFTALIGDIKDALSNVE